jgi:phosphatidylglycerol:prolipoprotein diacylglycerol transferase
MSRGFNYYFIEQPLTTLNIFGAAIPFPTALLIWEGGLGIYGGVVGGILAVLIYTHRHQLRLWRWLDIIAPGMLLAQAVGRWGNYFNQELYGPPTNMPWGITITNVVQRVPPYNDLAAYPLDTTFHPVFLYESLWNVLGFILLMWVGRKYAGKLFDGDTASLYLVWYPLGRVFIEALRPDAWTLGGIAAAQLVGIVFALIGFGLMYYRHRHPERATSPETHPTPQPQPRRPAKK